MAVDCDWESPNEPVLQRCFGGNLWAEIREKRHKWPVFKDSAGYIPVKGL